MTLPATALLAEAFAPPHMVVHSDLLGALTVDAADLIEFPDGLYGFPECRSFVLVAAARDGLYWLQSAEHGTLAFLLVDPFRVCEGYSVDLGPAELLELGARQPTDVAVLAIVTLPRSRAELPTANLQGPVVVNLRARRAKQLAIAESDHGVRVPVDLDALPAA